MPNMTAPQLGTISGISDDDFFVIYDTSETNLIKLKNESAGDVKSYIINNLDKYTQSEVNTLISTTSGSLQTQIDNVSVGVNRYEYTTTYSMDTINIPWTIYNNGVSVYIDGVRQYPSAFTVVSGGTSIQLDEIVPTDTKILISSIEEESGGEITYATNAGYAVEAGYTLDKNYLINGNFDFWQRGTSQTSSGYGSDDRWRNANSISTKTHSLQTFPLGTEIPGNPKYFSRTVVVTGGTTASYCFKNQRIENVRTLSGRLVTLSFYAKADATKNIAIEFQQNFGTGGTPSSTVASIGITQCALTTTWQKFIVSVNIPSISGKVLGTDNNDFLQANFWFDAGSNYTAYAGPLGVQSGTFDIAQVKLEEGSTATPFIARPLQQELALCQRYYYSSTLLIYGAPSNSSSYYRNVTVQFPVTMRNIPTTTNTGTPGALSVVSVNTTGVTLNYNIGDTTSDVILTSITANAEL